MGLTWHGPHVTQVVTAGAVRGLNQAAELVRANTVPLTPLRDGPLRASLTVSEATIDDPVAAVYTNLPYAVRQHEEMGYRHRDGQAKFLEVGAQRSRAQAAAVITAAIRRYTST